jgi:2-polyprenyl-6-methoxyphenol hydroxylase-like FAD-dependent oxidoreductase
MLPKGGFATLRERGIDVLRDAIAETAPFLADRTHLLEDWRDTSLLNVRTGRLRQWYAPGVVAIGDAAHVMSPVFGVGINYAVQDAVVAANILGPRLLEQEVRVSDLASVQRSRELPTRLMLMMQRLARPRFSRAGKTNARPWQGLFMIVWPLSDVAQRLIALGGWRAERFAPGAVYEPTWQRAATVVLQAFAPLGYFGFLGYWPFSSR